MQSNKQFNLSFYQNNTNIQNNSESVTNTKTISTKDLVNNSKVLKRSRRLEILRRYNFHLVKTNKISFNHFKKGVDSLKKLVENNWDKFVAVTPIITENTKLTPQIENEIQTLDNQIEVTPTLTEKQTNIQNTQNLIKYLQTQINKVVRSRDRNILFFDYSSFLCRTIKKITPKKHFKNINKRTEQNHTLSILHHSLVDEQSKLINKHVLLVA